LRLYDLIKKFNFEIINKNRIYLWGRLGAVGNAKNSFRNYFIC